MCIVVKHTLLGKRGCFILLWEDQGVWQNDRWGVKCIRSRIASPQDSCRALMKTIFHVIKVDIEARDKIENVHNERTMFKMI
jgi:hypothetical protein